MSPQNVVHIYPSLLAAEAAVRRLGKAAFPINLVSIVTQSIETTKKVHGFITAGEVAVQGASSGAWVGGFFGLLAGAVLVWVPGFDPHFVAGPFAAALLGGLEGVVAGAAVVVVGGAAVVVVAGTAVVVVTGAAPCRR